MLLQYRLIAPKLVMCGGTYKYAKMIYEIQIDNYLPCGLAYFIVEDGQHKMFFLDFLHPSIFGVRACILYTFIKVAFCEAIEVMYNEGILK